MNDFIQNYPPLKLPPAKLRISQRGNKLTVWCACRKRYVALTPEEWVRQHFVAYLTTTLGFPASLTAVEVVIDVNNQQQRADIVCYDNNLRPLLVVECKAPSVRLGQLTMNQACRYISVLHPVAVVLTNGFTHICKKLSDNTISQLPTYQELTGTQCQS